MPKPICDVFTNEHIELTPQSTAIIAGRLPSKMVLQSGLHGTIENATLQDGIHVVSTASTTQASQVPVMVCNNTKQVINIPKGTAIATFTPMEEEDIMDEPLTPTTTRSQDQDETPEFNLDNLSADPSYQQQILKILQEHTSAFMTKNGKLGECKHSPLKITLKPGAEPKHFSQYRYHPEVRKRMAVKIKEMLDQGIIEVSSRIKWVSPLVPVRKGVKKSRKHLQSPNDTYEIRPIVDLRGLNASCVFGRWIVPSVQTVIDTIAECKAVIFSTLDLKMGYFQIPLAQESQPLCGFHFENKAYAFKRCPQGLNSAPSHFSKVMATVLRDHIGKCATAYLDDILVFSPTKEQHLTDLHNVLASIEKSGLKLATSKCTFGATSCDFLGHTITSDGIQPSKDHTDAITTFPIPTKPRELKSFLGICGYFSNYIPKKGDKVNSLLQLLKKGVKWDWTPACSESFKSLKHTLASRPLLHYANHNKRFYLFTDASFAAVSGALMQQDSNGTLVPVAYCGRSLTEPERKRDILELELLAVCYSLAQFDYYLSYNKFTLYVDNNSLTKILANEKKLTPKLARWVLFISGFDYEIHHIKGTNNVLADGLSRRSYNINHTAADDKLDTFPLHHTDIAAITRSASAPKIEQTQHDLNRPQPEVQSPTEHYQSRSADTVKPPKSTKRVTFHGDTPHPNPTQRNTPFPDGLIPQDFQLAQQQDEYCSDLIAYLKTRKLPPTSKRRKRVYTKANAHCILGTPELLYNISPDNRNPHAPPHLRLLVPAEMQQKVIQTVHDSHVGTHFGVDKTLDLIQRTYVWRFMGNMIKKYVANCVTCNKAKNSLPLQHTPGHPVLSPLTPFFKIGADHIGKFAITPNKNLYIAMCVCHTSRLTVAWPTKSTSAAEFAKGFVKHVIAIHGVPHVMISDRGSNFISDVWKETALIMGMKLRYSSPFLPRSNGRSERQNRVITNILRCVCQNNPRTWDEMLPIVIFNMNNTRSRATGFSPHEIVYGKNLRQITDMTPPSYTPIHQHAIDVKYAQQQAMAAINQHNLAMLIDHKNVQSPTTSRLKEGDICFWRRPALDDPHNNKKLQSINRGPYKVLKRTPHQVFLHDITTDKPLKNPVSISHIIRPSHYYGN